MEKITKSQLQRALDGLTAATNRANLHRDRIMAFSQQTFGCDPGDVDFDAFIDQVDGGCGSASGMTADEFITGMRERIKAEGNRHE